MDDQEKRPDEQSAPAAADGQALPPVAEPLVVKPTEDELREIEERNDLEVRREMSRRSRRAFLVGAATAVAGAATWRWLDTRPKEQGVAWPFRRSLELNDRLAERYFKRSRLSPTFAASAITRNRINGHLGLDQNYDISKWNLSLVGVAGAAAPVVLTMDDILALPRRELITELRCIEGWSIIVKWTGARLADLMQKYPPPTRDGSRPDVHGAPQKLTRFVGMETPGRGYYVGLDMASAAHPQTLLAYAMNDEPLNWHHGSPLRLAIPVKYGIKNIKRIATIRYTDVRPADFWGEQGYDYYAGH
jgi:DMSO/TMAO reductase YedYZ molybdopterin-dependent catalytic subunit